jgi:predicted RNase H-like HicB family nuclease
MMKSIRRKLGFVEEQIEIQALVHEEDGSLWAEVPSCPGLFASGATLDELAEGLLEAWLLYHDSDPSERRGSGAASALTLRVPAFA